MGSEIVKCPGGGMADTGDLKSPALMGVRVRIPLRVKRFSGLGKNTYFPLKTHFSTETKWIILKQCCCL